MPLPNLNKRCVVTARSTGERCRNPAAFGCKSCRYHGARRQNTIRTGKDHPQYKHGERSIKSQNEYRKVSAEINTMEEILYALGDIKTKTRGRKPNIPNKN